VVVGTDRSVLVVLLVTLDCINGFSLKLGYSTQRGQSENTVRVVTMGQRLGFSCYYWWWTWGAAGQLEHEGGKVERRPKAKGSLVTRREWAQVSSSNQVDSQTEVHEHRGYRLNRETSAGP
jgi:hypothetical protein